jgi:hypothetical protein
MARSSSYSPGAKGEYADRPSDIPPKGWRQVLLRVWEQIGSDNLSLVAAGVAFYSLLAVFPALAAMVMIYGLFADPAEVQAQLAPLQDVIPADAFNILNTTNFTNYNTVWGNGAYPTTPNATFGRPTVADDPRIVQFGLRFTY